MRGALCTCILCRGRVAGFTTYSITKQVLFVLLFLIHQFNFGQCGAVARGAAIISDIGSGPGGVAWTNPPNATYTDDARTTGTCTVTPTGTETTHYLYARDFKFNVPSNATVCSIVVGIERRASGASASGAVINDMMVELVSGTTVAANYASSIAWSDTEKVVGYGSPGDCWGVTWSPADINHASFGVQVVTKMSGGRGSAIVSAEIDHIYIMVFYNTILPVELQSFNVFAQAGNRVQLNWRTASEKNNDRFVVERSRDGVNYAPVTEVKGAGNSLVERNYACCDAEPYPGVSYYRIKQIDFNGTARTYPSASVEMREPRGLQVFNGQDALVVRMSPTELQASALELVNAQGQRVWNADELVRSGAAEVRIPTGSFPQGVYFVRALTVNGQECTKVYVSKG